MNYYFNKRFKDVFHLFMLAMAFCFCLLYAAGPMGSVLATEAEPTAGFKGEGTGSNPYLIETLEDLETLAKNVNGDEYNEGMDYSGVYFKLTADIDMSGKYGEGKGSWTPIGMVSPFTGIFDGGGHKISGLYINDDELDAVGLFRNSSGEIKNLTVSGSVTGNYAYYCGGIVAVNAGTVKNCYNAAKVSGGDNGTCGGVAGMIMAYESAATVENCYNTGMVSGQHVCGGVAGGVAPIGVTATVKNCYNFGSVNCVSETDQSCKGGVVGAAQPQSGGSVAIENCYYLESTATYGWYAVDGLDGTTGKNDVGTAEPKSAAEFAIQATFVNWDFESIWTMNETLGRPVLQPPHQQAPHQHAVCGDSCTHETAHSNITYTAVSTADELVAAAEKGGNYYLAGDIEITEASSHDYTKAVVKVKNDFNLCLNGHTLSIKVTGDARKNGCIAMSVDGAANFTLCDCSDGKTGKLSNDSFAAGEAKGSASPTTMYTNGSGDITLYGGTVTNNNHSWVINTQGADGNVIFDGATMEGSSIIGASDGKKITVKSGIVGSEIGNVISAKNVAVEGGTVNGHLIVISASGHATFTGGTVKAGMWVSSNAVVEIGGDAVIDPVNYSYVINPYSTGNKYKIYLYGTPKLTKSITCTVSDTASDAPIIPHSIKGDQNYEGDKVSLHPSGDVAIGKYIVQDMPSKELAGKFSSSDNYVLRLADSDKNLKLDQAVSTQSIAFFPDANFRKFLSEVYDTDKDNLLYRSDINQITSMDVINRKISDLTGIEQFTELTSLNCSGNWLDKLDLSKNTKLETLNCSGNHLAALDLSKNISLTSLDASKNTVKIFSCSKYDLSSLTEKGMDTTKVSNVEGATLSDTNLTNFDGSGTITYTYDVGNAGVTNPTFALTYDHKYSAWKLTKDPTETETGTAERTCSSCNYMQTKTDVPNLADTTTWTKGDYVAPQKDTEGSQTYTSTDYGTVTVVLPALGWTVADVKEIVEQVLEDYLATNDTTKDDIQTVVDKALADNGISDVTVTVGGLTKKDATKEAEGSVSGSISITKGEESDNVTISKPIAKLPKTDADKVADAKKVVEEALEGYKATNGTTEDDIQSVIDEALTKAGISDVTVTVGELTKTEATESGTGSISGSISITKGDAEDSVVIDKTIEKLPVTDADRVAAAKQIVEEALAGITATNDTTKESIQSVIDEALTKAGISDVTVTVGELTKTEASESDTGSITGSISITKGDASDSVVIDKTIEKLPVTDADKVAAAKKVVEEAVAGITATNDTTKESIQSVINEALTKAGISDVTVTVGELTKTEATESDTGSITGNIEILSKKNPEVKDSVAIEKTIAKLPVHTHDYKWVIKKEPTPEREGEMTGVCTCGEVTTEAIPKIGESGTVIVEEDAKNECKGVLADKADVKGKVTLTDEEKEELKEGTDLVIILRLKDVHLTADTQEKTEIRDELGTNTLGTFLDIELLKKLGEIETPITETTDEIEITFEVPEHIRNTDSTVTRTYQIMRNHDGVVEILDAERYEEATHLLTFKTDKFSTYALVYRDVSKNPVAVSSVAIDKGDITLTKAGETAQLTASVTPADAANKKVTWTSSDPKVATVDDSGKVTAVGNGTCKITATTEDGGKAAACTVTVNIAKQDTPSAPQSDKPEEPSTQANSDAGIVTKKEQEKNELSLNAKLKVSQTGKNINVGWGKVVGADGYDIYVQYCGMKFTAKSITAVNGNKTTVTIKKVNGKPLNLKKNYKIYVRAYKLVDGKKVTLGKTITAHIIGRKNTKYTNVKAVKVKKSSYTLKKGKTATIKARTVLVSPGKKQLSDAHAKQFRYATDNKKVATVSKKGKIKAVGKGTCNIYVYARNGYAKKVKVKVK